MPISLNHIVSDVMNIASSGSNPIEFKIEPAQVVYWINEIRATLISQAIQKNQDLSDIWIQKISCLELEKTELGKCWDSEDEECSDGNGCFILRSIEELPDTIEIFGDNMIIRVTTLSGTVISKSNQFSEVYSKYNKYSNNKPVWWIENKRLYISGQTFIKKVDIYGIFDQPSDLANFKSCDDQSCWDYNSNYPCSLKMASMITDIVVRTKVYPYLQLPADNKNDADNAPEQVLPKKL